MGYAVKETYLTIQGEGGQAGRVAVFCRFAGCNLWTGKQADRSAAICQFCDTDFVGTDGPGGGKFADANDLAQHIESAWGTAGEPRWVVFTGGEPLLQLDAALVDAVHARGFSIAVESNGTVAAPPGIDWLTVSPKAGAPLSQLTGTELKLVFPQPDAMPGQFEHLAFDHFFVQPMDGSSRQANTQAAIQWCLAHPRWRLSVQVHKVLGIA